eukprot:XP_015571661.1 E3 ubiquitin-protein ligase ATL42 [Ricinus communis]
MIDFKAVAVVVLYYDDKAAVLYSCFRSLPFFKFSSLKGSKKGLECAVCLSKFEDIEVLRLLPRCKHAFHINCVDQWLEKHSSCPLCRCKVSAEDTTIFTYSNSMRFLWNQSEIQEDSSIEYFIQREESRQASSRFSIGSSFRRTDKVLNKDEEALIQEQEAEDSDDEQRVLHKFNHKIIISDVVLKNRWSNVSSSDLMFLNAEMLQDMSSNRFSSSDSNNEQFISTENEQMVKIKEEMEKKRLFESKFSTISNCDSPTPFPGNPSTSSDSNRISGHNTSSIIDSGDRRSVSEITGLSRFRNVSIKKTIRESFSGENNREEDRVRRQWLPIARRTVQWFANREKTSQQTQNRRQTLHV